MRGRRSMPVRKLDERALRYAARMRGLKDADTVAAELGVSRPWLYKIWAHCRRTGDIPRSRPMGRPPKVLAAGQADEILAEYSRRPAGVVRLVKGLRENKSKITYVGAYRIMSAEGLVEKSKAKPRRRKWVRFERKYSNAMWHVDWHIMKNPSVKGANLVVFLDDASRCVTGFGVFAEATSANTVLVLRNAIKRFGAPGQILSDHGTQFTANNRDVPRRSWTPTYFEQELLDSDISHIMARVRHPQTGGKIERFFQTLEREMDHFGSVARFIEYYNEDRLHFSLDIDHGETPLLAFKRRRAADRLKKANPRWMEEDSNE